MCQIAGHAGASTRMKGVAQTGSKNSSGTQGWQSVKRQSWDVNDDNRAACQNHENLVARLAA